jgi:hypothetical protein
MGKGVKQVLVFDAPVRHGHAACNHWEGIEMRNVAIVLGLLFAVIAVVYWVVPAGSLPGFFPGFEAGGTRVHVKHGIASVVVAVVLFAFAWYAGRSR